jgi:hypothetical protein
MEHFPIKVFHVEQVMGMGLKWKGWNLNVPRGTF